MSKQSVITISAAAALTTVAAFAQLTMSGPPDVSLAEYLYPVSAACSNQKCQRNAEGTAYECTTSNGELCTNNGESCTSSLCS